MQETRRKSSHGLALLLLVCAACREDTSASRSASVSATPTSSASAVGAASAAPPATDLAAVVRGIASRCEDSDAHAIAFAPLAPDASRPLRVMVTHETPLASTKLVAVGPDGEAKEVVVERRHGPPSSEYARFDAPRPGRWSFVALTGDQVVACRAVEVASEPTPTNRFSKLRAPWKAERDWSRREENLYSAWIEKLFDAEASEQPSFAALHEVTQRVDQNFFHDYLGLSEDAPLPSGLRLDPDCADLPYFLRAYFAWKRELPFAYSSCTRGTEGQPPRCLKRYDHTAPLPTPTGDRVRKFENFVRLELKDVVHSGTGRTRAEADDTDYYPIGLSAETLRPGVVYADPYGHVLVVAKLIPQSPDAGGVMFAVDGQPDGTVARKRFWEGNFLFAMDEVAMGSPGFKRFRKVSRRGQPLTNAEILADPEYADFGQNQYAGGSAAAFYALVDAILSPAPRDPERAMLETIGALEEQVKTRVQSVGNGEKRFTTDRSEIEMPEGPAIFETTGDWENFSTPSRDLRLLIAIDVATGYPARVESAPKRFVLATNEAPSVVKARLEKRLAEELEKRSVDYVRSDGSTFSLKLSDVVARKEALEMAYNPNDCVEHRWGAPKDSDERKTCARSAGGSQRLKMQKVRAWFRDRKRPARR